MGTAGRGPASMVILFAALDDAWRRWCITTVPLHEKTAVHTDLSAFAVCLLQETFTIIGNKTFQGMCATGGNLLENGQDNKGLFAACKHDDKVLLAACGQDDKGLFAVCRQDDR